MPKHLSDKVDDIFSFAGRLEVVLPVKHFRHAFFRSHKSIFGGVI